MGVEDEKTGVALYSKLAEVTENDELRKTYSQLAEEERGHLARFEKLHEDLGGVQPTETYPGEYVAYLQSMLESRAFPDEEAALKIAEERGSDDAGALELSLRFERDTLVLLNELRGMVPEKDRCTVDELAQEEQGHLVVLTKAREKLAST
jgi:rubrerythrin